LIDNPALFAEAVLEARNQALYQAKLQVPPGVGVSSMSCCRNEPEGVVAVEVTVSWTAPPRAAA
jgi:hypothetical protein